MRRKLTLGVFAALAAMALVVGLVAKPVPRTAVLMVTSPESALAPLVTVTRVAPADFTEAVMVTGSLVAREEILVGPEVEGLRIVELLAEEGDGVKKGQVLARLVHDTLDAQLAQNDAALARADAAIAQARSNIAQSEARLVESRNALARASQLRQAGHVSEAVFDQREQAAKTAEAQLIAARDGLKLAEAEKAQVEAQRRELLWRRGRTEVTAPADGVISRRNARVGSIAASAAEPLFRIIANGEIELDAEVVETRLPRVKSGQPATVDVSGVGMVPGRVRLVLPEVDKATRLGRVRISLGANPLLRIGSFARGSIETATSRGLAVPASSILYGPDRAQVQVVRSNRIESRTVTTGLASNALVEVREGLSEGELVVTKSGTFLRDGDAVRPMLGDGPVASESRG
jgi:RND family efflux transporter MFP subunit